MTQHHVDFRPLLFGKFPTQDNRATVTDTFISPSSRHWHPSPAVRISFWIHCAGIALLLFSPATWLWVLGVLAGNHLILGLIGLWPRSSGIGANLVRLPAAAVARNEVAITFDDGPDPEVTPAVLEILDRYGAKASFFCVGCKVRAHPDLVREIARRGHSVENHSEAHSIFFACYGMGRFRREIESAQRAIAGVAGSGAQFFRAPMGIRNPLLDPVLARLGLRYVSWTRRGFDTVTRDPRKVLDRLARDLAAGDILLMHDGSSARTADGRPVVLEVLPALLERVAAAELKPVSLPATMR